MPLTKQAATSAAYQTYLTRHPRQKAAAASLSFGFQDATFPGYGTYYTNLNTAVSNLAAGQSPAKVLPTLQKQTEQLFK